ncbi:MAG: tetratricopeptide repeat protein [bacterium]
MTANSSMQKAQKDIENDATFKYHKIMIPKYDQYLEKYLKEYQENPRSRVFAPLAEAYRKSGLLDEAIEICREGLEYHPNFISGMVALARCYFDKGLYTATIKELEKVISEVPDNYLAQKLLAQSYALVGDKNNALKTFKMLLFMNPKDEEAKAILADIEKNDKKILEEDLLNVESEDISEPEEETPPTPVSNQPSFKVIDDIMQEADLGFEEKRISQAFNIPQEEIDPEKVLTDISTMTMGELLEAQGHKEKALEVYKNILLQDPDQPMIKDRIASLEKELGVHNYREESIHLEERTEEATNSPEDNKNNIEEMFTGELIVSHEVDREPVTESTPKASDDLDDQWIFQGADDDTKVTKLQALLNKVKSYKASNLG